MQSTAKYVINVTSSVIYYCTDPQQHGMYLFCVIKKGCVINDVIHASVLSSIKMCALFSLSYKFNLIAELKIYHLHSHEAFNTAGHGKQYA